MAWGGWSKTRGPRETDSQELESNKADDRRGPIKERGTRRVGRLTKAKIHHHVLRMEQEELHSLSTSYGSTLPKL